MLSVTIKSKGGRKHSLEAGKNLNLHLTDSEAGTRGLPTTQTEYRNATNLARPNSPIESRSTMPNWSEKEVRGAGREKKTTEKQKGAG